MSTLTEQAKALIEIAGKATPGTWDHAFGTMRCEEDVDTGDPSAGVLFTNEDSAYLTQEDTANFDAIVSLHNDAPRILEALVAEVERLTAKYEPWVGQTCFKCKKEPACAMYCGRPYYCDCKCFEDEMDEQT